MSWLDNLVRSKAYKNFMAKLYGWGAAVVIVGALFKINHWPGGSLLLIIGMGTEVVIFFLSAFEPPHVEYDWSLVFPELAGMKEGHELNIEEEEGEVQNTENIATPSTNIRQVSNDPLTAQLDKMLEDAHITPELIERLGQGMGNLADSALAMNSMASAAASTDKFVTSMDGAAEAVNGIREASVAMSTLSNIYTETAQALSSGDVSYVDETKRLATSLASINAMYEMQLQNSTSQLEATKEVEQRLQTMMNNFADSAEGILKYKEQVDALTRKVAELNNVYGNMLAAMQTRI